MSVLGRMLSHLLERRQKRLTLLVGTSGDTGSSAIEAVRGLPRLRIVVLYPLRGFSNITAVQEAQMTSVGEVRPPPHLSTALPSPHPPYAAHRARWRTTCNALASRAAPTR